MAAYDYIRCRYGVDPKVGQRITMDGKPGIILRPLGDPAHLAVRFEGETRTAKVHPTWEVDYAPARLPMCLLNGLGPEQGFEGRG